MALVFQRRLAIPLWAIAFFTVALTAPPTARLFLMPPTTVFLIAAVGIAAIIFLMSGPIPWLRASRALVRVRPSGHEIRRVRQSRWQQGPGCARSRSQSERSRRRAGSRSHGR
jgi:hypothetical protein